MITFEISQGKDWLWYWHAKHRNGRIVADGGQGYTRKHDCGRAILRFVRHIRRRDFLLRPPE